MKGHRLKANVDGAELQEQYPGEWRALKARLGVRPQRQEAGPRRGYWLQLSIHLEMLIMSGEANRKDKGEPA